MRRYAQVRAATARCFDALLGRRAGRRAVRRRGNGKPNGRAKGAAASRPTRCRRPTRAAARSPCRSIRRRRTAPTIEIFVARLAAFSAEPRPDPLLLISGGPGQSTVDFYLQLRGAFEPARRDRDLILVDQRGTGRSAKGFACEVPDDLSLDTAGSEALARIVDACVAELEHDPRFYTTSVAVRDLERVRVALGIETWNVYGVSYGTRVAQHYLRRYPERVRALVLDGVVPPPLALGPDVAREAQRALEQIFARCAADALCGTRFAALPQLFAEVLARLDAGAADETDPPPIERARAAHARALHELQRGDRRVAAGADQRSARGQLRPARGPGAHAAARAAGVVELSDEQLRDLHGRRAVRRAATSTDGLDSTYLGHRDHGRARPDLRALARRRDGCGLQDARRQRRARAALVRRVRSRSRRRRTPSA